MLTLLLTTLLQLLMAMLELLSAELSEMLPLHSSVSKATEIEN